LSYKKNKNRQDMSYELKPRTDAGKRFAEAADSLQDRLRARAGEADQASTINAKNFTDMRETGIASAFVPEACGGFGLTSVYDWMAGMSRLGRGDGSAAIAMNMHLAVSRGMAGAWGAAKASGNAGLATQMEGQFAQIISGDMYLCATATEPGTDNLHPFTEATRVAGGWLINGTKIFVTGSPVASHVAMNLRVRGEGEDGADIIGSIMMPLNTDGIEPQDDWQAMGMRASGSQSIKFTDVAVPEHMVRPMGPWGLWSTTVLMNRNLSNLPLLGAFLGIAEHAYELALEAAAKKPKADKPRNADRPGIQHMIGEMEIALSTARAMVGQMGMMVDDFLAEYDGKDLPLERAHELLKDHQSMKWVVNRNAIEIVNRAMDIVGGGGFMDTHPLSRLYRDVRAGPFMQPYSPTEAREYIGKIVLGVYPEN
jgi:alkylation response protein AidB-like acyl-CoA dehydrogenase